MSIRRAAIRPATETDVPAILALIEGLAEYEKLRDACVATEAQLRATLFGATPAAEVLLAVFDDDSVAGFALYCSNYSTFLAKPGLWLEDLFVWPEHRGLGIGRQLLAALAQVAVSRDCGRVEWSVLDWNTPSIEFYERLGARGLTEWTTYRLTGEAMQSLAASAS